VQQARQRLEGLEDEFPCASWLPMVWQNPAAQPFTWSVTQPIPQAGWGGRLWRFCKIVMAVSLLATGGTIGLRLSGILQPSELWAFDQLMQLRPHEPPDARLLLVQIREADLSTYQFPISDRILAQLLQKLASANPAVIGLDIYRDRPQEPGHAELTR
jgi:CHASE2 domain-containing sensor protein